MKAVTYKGSLDTIIECCKKGDKWGVIRILSDLAKEERAKLLNQRDRFGDTALTAAASEGHNSVVEYLLEIPGVDPNVGTSGTCFTPLIMAAAKGYPDVVFTLLKKPEVTLEIKDINGLTAAEEAAHAHHLEISEIISRKMVR